jgi:hypothetical protein
VVWPVFLLVAVELLARVPWPHGINWQLLRWAGMVPVAAVAALVSYRHLSGLLAFYREEPLVCVLGPLAVDGLMVMATGAILATGQHTTNTTSTTEAPPRITKAAAPRTIKFQSVSAVPDAPSRDRRAPTTTPIPPASPSDAPAPAPTPTTMPIPEPAAMPGPARPEIPTPAVVATRITGADTTSPDGSPTALRATARKPSPRPRTTDTTPAGRLAAPAPDTLSPRRSPPRRPRRPSSPHRAGPGSRGRAQYRTEHGTAITPGQLAVRLKVTSDQAAQALAV